MMRTREEILTDLAITGARAGDQKSFRLLYQQWNPTLCIYAVRLTQDSDAVSDIMQEAWIAMAKGLGRLEEVENFRPWAYRIVSNKCRDWIRSQQSRRRVAEEALGNQEDDEIWPSGDPVSRLRESLNRLESNQRIILTLFYLEEMSIHEIGAALDVPDGTVKSRLYNARRTLKDVLEYRSNE